MRKQSGLSLLSENNFSCLRNRRVEGKKQRYLTHFTRMPDGKMGMQPTEDTAHLDARRKRMGLPPIAEYIKFLEELVNAKEKAR